MGHTLVNSSTSHDLCLLLGGIGIRCLHVFVLLSSIIVDNSAELVRKFANTIYALDGQVVGFFLSTSDCVQR